MKASNTGSGSFGNVESWTVTETVTPLAVSDTTTSIGDAVVVVTRKPDTDLVEGNRLGLSQDSIPAFKDALPVAVNQVTMTGPALASLAADSAFGVFLSSRLRIPGIETGTPLAALDVACQAGGIRRQTGINARDDYWSLRGHTVGFSGDGDIIEPRARDRALQSRNGGASYSFTGETVLYQEIEGLVTAARWSTSGYPLTVTGDTVQPARGRTYIKATILPTNVAGNPISFALSFGPNYRKHGSTDNLTNQTRIAVTLVPGATTGTLTGNIVYHDAAGGVASVTTGSSGSLAALARTSAITLTIEISMSGGGLSLRIQATSAAGTTGMMQATTPTLSSDSATLYSRRWNLNQNSSSAAGFADLVIARSTEDRWGSFAASGTYALPSAVVSESGAGTTPGSPIAPFEGELWDYVKQVCSGRKVELASLPNGLTLRALGSRVIPLDRRAAASRTISGRASARTISLTNHRTRALDPVSERVYKGDTIYSVNVGETKKVNVDIPEGVRFIPSPRPWYNSKAAKGIVIQFPEYLDGFGDLEYDAAGKYYITARDGFPVNPLQWTDYGGRVYAAVVDGRAELTLVGPTREIPGVPGPFSLGESAASSDYAVLRLFGMGVTSAPVDVTLPSGAGKSETRVEQAATVTNIALGNIAEVYDAAPWVAQRVAGPQITLTANVPLGLLEGWGLTPGALVSWENNVFRVDSSTISSGIATLSCSKLSRLSDMPGKDRTLSAFKADYADMTLHDYSIRPLASTAPAA